MPALSDYARRKKIDFFLEPLAKDARILEIGCGAKWVGEHLRANGWTNYLGMDLEPPADVIGDLRNWRALGLAPGSFDAIVAFEVIEHVDLVRDSYDMLRPGGRLLLTSPVPHMDWAMKLLEAAGLNQKRTSPHENLVYFEEIELFEPIAIRRVAGLSQWGVLEKPRWRGPDRVAA